MLDSPLTLYSILALVVILLLAMFLSGCVSIGRGSATLITAKLDTNAGDFNLYYPDLVTTGVSMRQLTPGATTDTQKYARYLLNKLGCENCKTSELSVVVRDRTKTPPFLPVDINIEKELLGLYLNKDLSSKEKEKLASIAKGNMFNVPDLPNRTAIHDTIPGMEKRYYYYPRIQIDFASRLRSPSQLDRFAYLGMAVKLKDPQKDEGDGVAGENQCEAVRFIDFNPKAADIVEFTRGQLTQKAEVAAKANLSKQDINKITSGTSAGTDADKTSAGTEKTRTGIFAPDLSLSMSETFVNALKDSIEARTAGILHEGQAFFSDFRAIKTRRIGGTYNFDMMLEVPATLEKADGNSSAFISTPCVTDIRADVYMVAVVRHVFKRGYTGWLNRVPEPDNDKTYYQVVIERAPDVLLWKYGGVPWVKVQTTLSEEFVISVTTNRDDARYVIKAVDNTGDVLGSGSGASSRISIPLQSESRKVRIEFLDVIEVENGNVHVFSEAPGEEFIIEKEVGGERSFVGNYTPKKTD